MNPSTHPSFAPLAPGVRVACTLAAAVCAAAVHVGVLGLFDQASSDPWVNPTPQVLEAKARCDAARDRSARERCIRAVVARAAMPGTLSALAPSR